MVAFVTSQENLKLTISTPLGDDVLLIVNLEGVEGISVPFEFSLNLHSLSPNIDFNALLGAEAHITLDCQSSKRYFSGIVGEIIQDVTQVDASLKSHTYYQAKIYPKLWLLKFNCDYRVFQNLSTIDIIMTILKENGITTVSDQTTICGRKVREYCVQYGESSFDFISRLMEEEGIFYFFKHTPNSHLLILTDTSNIAEPAVETNVKLIKSEPTTPLLNVIQAFNLQEQVVISQYSSTDFNYLTPSTSLYSKVSGEGKGGGIYVYPGLFSTMSDGERITNLRIQALEWPKSIAQGIGTAPNFYAGASFTLMGHARQVANKKYILYKVKHSIFPRKDTDLQQPPLVYQNEFWVFPGEIQFRTPQQTAKKRIYGHQTATVTGSPGEEVWCDQYGRIKIKFHWDVRSGQNDSSSCWIRVAQVWAGNGWGGAFTPRVGMEVVVTFLDGDPDRPLVIGCVYNGNNILPNISPTQSTIKTNTSKGGNGYNEIRFDDKNGAEKISIHAQKNLDVVIEAARTEKIKSGNDTLTLQAGSREIDLLGQGTHSLSIARGDDVVKIQKGNNNYTITEGNQTVTLSSGNQQVTLNNGDQSITLVKGNSSVTLQGGDLTINVGGSITISSDTGTTIQSNGTIFLNASSVMTPKGEVAVI